MAPYYCKHRPLCREDHIGQIYTQQSSPALASTPRLPTPMSAELHIPLHAILGYTARMLDDSEGQGRIHLQPRPSLPEGEDMGWWRREEIFACWT
jgi:hypothetical protein